MTETETQPQRDPEWKGATSSRFTTNRKYIVPPKAPEQAHPLFNMAGRKHYENGPTPEWQFKVQKKYIVPIDHDKEDK